MKCNRFQNLIKFYSKNPFQFKKQYFIFFIFCQISFKNLYIKEEIYMEQNKLYIFS